MAPGPFNKYDVTILKHIWALTIAQKRLLDHRVTYLSKVGDFIKKVKTEEYPTSHQDNYMHGCKVYHISYVFTSGAYLQKLAQDKPDTLVAYQLRVNEGNNFYQCVVRVVDEDKLKERSLLNNGAIRQ